MNNNKTTQAAAGRNDGKFLLVVIDYGNVGERSRKRCVGRFTSAELALDNLHSRLEEDVDGFGSSPNTLSLYDVHDFCVQEARVCVKDGESLSTTWIRKGMDPETGEYLLTTWLRSYGK
jgi:hypothetical protein